MLILKTNKGLSRVAGSYRHGIGYAGYAYYLQKKYQPAREQFEALQSITPDDLSAQFYLSLIYAQLGMKKKLLPNGAQAVSIEPARGK